MIAASASTLSSFLWYAIFLKKGSPVIKEEISKKAQKDSMVKISWISFLAHLFSAVAIFMLIGAFQIGTFGQGMRIIFAVCSLLIAVSGMKKVVFENKSLENFILGAGHDFINVLVVFSILIFLVKH